MWSCCTIRRQKEGEQRILLVYENKNKHCAQKNNSKKSAPKSNKTIINCSEYNKALAARGNISVYISEATAEKAFRRSRKTHKAGHPQVYRESLIELILTLRKLFRLPLRQSSGFAGNVLVEYGN
ncbi:MAG: transposase [Elusimicrobiota bacterium]|nr:transposase [Elusimicrobiota bacterium]